MTFTMRNSTKTNIDSAKPRWRLTLFFGKKLETNTIIAMGRRILNPLVISNILRKMPKIANPQNRKINFIIIRALKSNHSWQLTFCWYVLKKSICCGICAMLKIKYFYLKRCINRWLSKIYDETHCKILIVIFILNKKREHLSRFPFFILFKN